MASPETIQQEEAKEGGEALMARQESARDFLESYREGNKQELSDKKNEELDRVLETLDNPEKGIEPAEDIIGKIIKGRTEKLRRFPNLKWADADHRIVEYISKTTLSAAEGKKSDTPFLQENGASVFESYLDCAEKKVKSKDEKDGIAELKEKIKKIKSAKQAEKPEEAVTNAIPSETETIVGAKDETIIEKKEEAEKPAEDLNSLLKKKQEIEKQLLDTTDEAQKARLLEEKKETLAGLLEAASKVSDKNLAAEVKIEGQRRFDAEALKKQKTGKDFYETYRERYYSQVYNEIIEGSTLSEEQKRILLQEGELAVSSWPSEIILGRADVAIAIKRGWDINQIKRTGWLGFSKKIKAGKDRTGNDLEFDNLEDFNRRIASSQERMDIDEEVARRVDKKRDEYIDKYLTTQIMEEKIKEAIGQARQEEMQRKEEEKSKNLKDLQSCWKQAQDIDKTLKARKYEYQMEGGEVLKGKKNIEKKKGELSDEIINLANKVADRKLRKEAIEATGYNPEAKRPNKKLQGKFRRYLTNEVKKIMENNQGEKINDTNQKSEQSVFEQNVQVDRGAVILLKEQQDKIKRAGPPLPEMPEISDEETEEIKKAREKLGQRIEGQKSRRPEINTDELRGTIIVPEKNAILKEETVFYIDKLQKIGIKKEKLTGEDIEKLKSTGIDIGAIELPPSRLFGLLPQKPLYNGKEIAYSDLRKMIKAALDRVS